jgi:ABC-2 type transport system permease protein
MRILLRTKLWTLKNRFLRLTWGRVLKSGGFSMLGGMLLGLLYVGLRRLLEEVNAAPLIGGLLVLKLTAMAFLTTFFMMIFSSTLASFTTLFFARDLGFLMHRPLPFRSVFLWKSLETGIFSSWMVALVLVPFLAAFGRTYGLGAGFYAALAGLFVPFAAAACSLGIGLSLGLMCLFPSKRVREVMLIVAIVAGCGLYILFRWLEPEKLVRPDALESLVQYLAVLEAPVAPYLPSWWMAASAGAFLSGRTQDLFFYGGLLVGSALLLTGGLALFAEKAYYNGWTLAQESSRRNRATRLGSEWRWIPRLFPVRLRALLGKDTVLFVRDSNQWSQFLLLGSLMAVYLISIAKLPLDAPYLKSLISFLNIGMVGFVLASVALRLIFPAVSLEGRSWWCLRSAPLSLWSLLLEKFLMGFLPLSVMGLILVGVSNRLLGADAFVHKLSTGTSLAMAGALAGLGTGFGALFPRFQVENIAQIETSPGGFLFMICALFYVGLTLALEAVLVRMHYFSLVRSPEAWQAGPALAVIGCLVLLNGAAMAFPLMAGKRNLEKMDV